MLNWTKLTLIVEKLILPILITIYCNLLFARSIYDISFELPDGNGRDLGIAGQLKYGNGIQVSDGNGNEVIEIGGNWYEKSIPAHL